MLALVQCVDGAHVQHRDHHQARAAEGRITEMIDQKLLRPGTQRRNWKRTLLGDGSANALADIAASDITMFAE